MRKLWVGVGIALLSLAGCHMAPQISHRGQDAMSPRTREALKELQQTDASPSNPEWGSPQLKEDLATIQSAAYARANAAQSTASVSQPVMPPAPAPVRQPTPPLAAGPEPRVASLPMPAAPQISSGDLGPIEIPSSEPLRHN